MIVRIYDGDDGESHFQELTPDEFADIANNVGPGDITVGQRAAGWWQDYHTAPRHQYVVFMSGGAEIEVASGDKRQFGPGDVLVAEDLTGHGHIARSIGDDFRVSLAVPLAE
jgi:hypothetical protein